MPFRFIAAARYAPQWEEALEQAMFACLSRREKLAGQDRPAGGRVRHHDGARFRVVRRCCALTLPTGLPLFCARSARRSACTASPNELKRIAARRGFALRDAIENSQAHGGTYLGKALSEITEPYDRLIVITDEQSHDRVPSPQGRGYVINVASYKNGVGYGKWTHIDGWSESVIEYVREFERTDHN